MTYSSTLPANAKRQATHCTCLRQHVDHSAASNCCRNVVQAITRMQTWCRRFKLHRIDFTWLVGSLRMLLHETARESGPLPFGFTSIHNNHITSPLLSSSISFSPPSVQRVQRCTFLLFAHGNALNDSLFSPPLIYKSACWACAISPAYLCGPYFWP